jgi:hypothetical protein
VQRGVIVQAKEVVLAVGVEEGETSRFHMISRRTEIYKVPFDPVAGKKAGH